MREATLVEVAREAGVSQSTASRVLNGSTRSVRPENAARVQAAATRLGYAVDIRAQETARGTSQTVAIVVQSFRDTTTMNLVADICRVADELGYMASVIQASIETARVAEKLRGLRGHRPRAIVVAHRGELPPLLERELSQYKTHGGRAYYINVDDENSRRLGVAADLFRSIIWQTAFPSQTTAQSSTLPAEVCLSAGEGPVG